MGIYLVKHEWDANKSDEVKTIVSGIVAKEHARDLPNGHQLLGVMLSASKPEALCVWESKSQGDLEGLLRSMNPPTKHEVSEFQILFGVSKV